MELFNLKLSQLARQLRHTFKALQCHMGVSENWILEATALHEIQQEPKTGQHPLGKAQCLLQLLPAQVWQGARARAWRISELAMTQNDTHAETGSLIDTIMEGVWFAIFWLNSLGVSLGGFKLQEVINSRYGTPRIADSFSAKICKAGCSNLFFEETYAASVGSCH